MLDECKGDKLEEVLATFSTIVLHKRLGAEKTHNTSIAKRLALAPKLKTKDQDSLLSLAIAHHASLTTALHRKDLLRSRYQDYQQMLDEKGQELQGVRQRLIKAKKDDPAPDVPKSSLQQIRQRYDTYWQGDSRWLKIILDGDVTRHHDELLGNSFESTWEQVTAGALPKSQARNQQAGLLHDLETRVAAQQARLRQWKDFREKLDANKKFSIHEVVANEPSKSAQAVTINFSAHKDIDKRQMELLRGPPQLAPVKDQEHVLPTLDIYANLVKSMRQELDDIDAPKQRSASTAAGLSSGPSLGKQPGFAPNPLDTPAVPTRRDFYEQRGRGEVLGRVKALPIARITKQRESQPAASQAPRGRGATGAEKPTIKNTLSTTDSATKLESEAPKPSARLTGPKVEEFDQPTAEDDEDSMLAARIVAATLNAGPSPVKSKPSLTERTRRSLALASPEDVDSFPPKTIYQSDRQEEPPSVSLPEPNEDTKITLAERTRRSMSMLPTQQRGHQKSTNKHRHSKQFPTNQFETPRKQSTLETLEEMTPPEKLFSGDADYASVFKSRPKIAMSPTGSPAPKNSPGMNALLDSIERSDHAEHWESSPLARVAGKAGM